MSGLQVVWFKRDLRVRDHRALVEAARSGPVLGLYVFEPSMWRAPDAHAGHLQFVNECLEAMCSSFEARGGRLIRLVGELPDVLERLHALVPVAGLWSHEETGNLLSFRRDQRVADWARRRGIPWVEYPQGGVVRRLKTRDGWAQIWARRMSAPLLAAPEYIHPPVLPSKLVDVGCQTPTQLGLSESARPLQVRGGEDRAHAVLSDFLTNRGVAYRSAMSSPLTAWSGCSRISPHLAWGSISLRHVYQATGRRQQHVALAVRRGVEVDPRWSKSLESFQSRLRWRSHFMQKLEDAPGLERRAVNRAYESLREDAGSGSWMDAWTEGQTGWPLVDACMRCLHETGWLNFRMRAMLMSISSWTLWQPWRPSGLHLARGFTDYEPGIHWAQVQMQSGVTGINTPRMYNPTKQAREQDPKGEFIRRWVPELAAVSDAWIHAPWQMPALTQRMCGVDIGRDYPAPVVEHDSAIRAAKQRLQRVRRSPGARAEAGRVYRKHGSRRGRRQRW